MKCWHAELHLWWTGSQGLLQCSRRIHQPHRELLRRGRVWSCAYVQLCFLFLSRLLTSFFLTVHRVFLTNVLCIIHVIRIHVIRMIEATSRHDIKRERVRVFRRLDIWCLFVYSAMAVYNLVCFTEKTACNDTGQKIKQSEIFAAQHCSLISILETAVGKG